MSRHPPEISVYTWDGNRLDLAAEYRDNPRGPYSLELQRILDRMRTSPLKGRFALVVLVPFESWGLVRLSGVRGVPPTPVEGVTYRSVGEAEWDIFKRRWEELTGIPITIGDNKT